MSVLYRDHVKEEQSFITIHDLFETFSPCKSIDSSSPDTTEVETEEQRSVSEQRGGEEGFALLAIILIYVTSIDKATAVYWCQNVPPVECLNLKL
ncbi:hypothetical protein T4A_14236 [Trichinella pseudospiralis]|uniref:Uncharacterized protein n=1 Tax=Trichinella pseudospiralis TaxID=6337 RepID=A0A0V1EFD6_TRIPS|nr:hypothetical protein T4A_14236 [Trichinella pseudospiralis]